jgi:hypothetical protein
MATNIHPDAQGQANDHDLPPALPALSPRKDNYPSVIWKHGAAKDIGGVRYWCCQHEQCLLFHPFVFNTWNRRIAGYFRRPFKWHSGKARWFFHNHSAVKEHLRSRHDVFHGGHGQQPPGAPADSRQEPPSKQVVAAGSIRGLGKTAFDHNKALFKDGNISSAVGTPRLVTVARSVAVPTAEENLAPGDSRQGPAAMLPQLLGKRGIEQQSSRVQPVWSNMHAQFPPSPIVFTYPPKRPWMSGSFDWPIPVPTRVSTAVNTPSRPKVGDPERNGSRIYSSMESAQLASVSEMSRQRQSFWDRKATTHVQPEVPLPATGEHQGDFNSEEKTIAKLLDENNALKRMLSASTLENKRLVETLKSAQSVRCHVQAMLQTLEGGVVTDMIKKENEEADAP